MAKKPLKKNVTDEQLEKMTGNGLVRKAARATRKRKKRVQTRLGQIMKSMK